MDIKKVRDELKSMALLKDEGATEQIRAAAAARYAALRAELLAAVEPMKSAAYWRR